MSDDGYTPEDYQAEVRRLRSELRLLQGGGEGGGVTAATPPLRQRDILRALLAERTAKAHNLSRASVRLTRNARGEVQPEVMVEVSDEAAHVAVTKAQAEAARVFDALCLVYSLHATPPPAKGNGEKGGTDD